MYSREQIDQVRSAVDIVEVIREYVPSLKVAGRSVRGLCPFHSERTPSFHVHPEKGIFKCFGCGEGGDAVGFISKIEQINFAEALEKLADRAGVRLQNAEKISRNEPEGIKEKLHRVLSAASRLYEDFLWDDRVGHVAREYLEKRSLTQESIRLFHLGVAPATGSGIFETLVKKGFSIELCQQAGLVSRSSTGRFYDPLFGRLIFPIYDSFGHVIGFGGRVLPNSKPTLLGEETGKAEDEGPKYLNSPETPVFSKGKALYGIREAKAAILESRSVIILEGYMDVIGVSQGGVKNAVATLGTAFTRDHAKILKRYAVETIFSFFDPDEAGQKAAVRSLEPILQEEIFPRVVQSEGPQDPDEIILEKGKEHFDGLIQQAPDFVDYMIGQWSRSGQMTLQQKAEASRQLAALVAQSPNDILRSEWMGRIAQKMGLNRESLEQEFKKQRANRLEIAPSATRSVKPTQRTMPSAEEEFLQLLMSHSTLWASLELSSDDFLDDRNKSLFLLIKSQMSEKGQLSVPALIEDIFPEHKEWLVRLSMEEKEFSEPQERCQQLVRDIRLKRTREKLRRLKDRVAAGQASLDEQAEYKDLLKRVKGSSPAAF